MSERTHKVTIFDTAMWDRKGKVLAKNKKYEGNEKGRFIGLTNTLIALIFH